MGLIKALLIGLSMVMPSPETAISFLHEHVPFPMQRGKATMYGTEGDDKWHGSHMANGEKFRPKERITCAHKTLPLGTVITVESVETGNRIHCPVTDRGPYAVRLPDGDVKAVSHGYEAKPHETRIRILDLSYKAHQVLGAHGIEEVVLRWWPHQTDKPVELKSGQIQYFDSILEVK